MIAPNQIKRLRLILAISAGAVFAGGYAGFADHDAWKITRILPGVAMGVCYTLGLLRQTSGDSLRASVVIGGLLLLGLAVWESIHPPAEGPGWIIAWCLVVFGCMLGCAFLTLKLQRGIHAPSQSGTVDDNP